MKEHKQKGKEEEADDDNFCSGDGDYHDEGIGDGGDRDNGSGDNEGDAYDVDGDDVENEVDDVSNDDDDEK